jgi:hypothetical protein
MSAKNRTTVTIIETHEVWVIRRPAPRLRDDVVTIGVETTQPDSAVPASSEPDRTSEANSEKSKEQL